jgi:ribosomal protein S18 acetylase RimI-like enzyme
VLSKKILSKRIISAVTLIKNMNEIVINKIGIEQIDQLQQIGRQTFEETFAESNSAENMVIYLEEAYAYEKISAELNDPNSFFYYAMMDQDVIGYLKLNMGVSQTELKDNDALEIERIYVLKAFQGKKVGQLLFDKAITIAKEQHVAYIWLGVWEENKRAIQFYTKNGFVEFDQHVFVLGDEAQTDIMMKLQLNKI